MKKRIAIAALLSASLLLTACNATSKLEKIDVEQAKNVALTALGISGEELTYIEAELKTRNGQKYYDVDITVDGVEYDFDIDAISGVIIARDTDDDGKPLAGVTNAAQTSTPDADPVSPYIGEEKAYEIAYTDAGYTAAHARMVTCELVEKDGVWRYRIQFYGVSQGYTYEVDAVTGEIRSRAESSIKTPARGNSEVIDPEMNVSHATSEVEYNVQTPTSDPTEKIELMSYLDLFEIACTHAGLKSEETELLFKSITVNQAPRAHGATTDDFYYELYFRAADGTAYHYEINAMTAQILSCERAETFEDLDNPQRDADGAVTLPADAISPEEALANALNKWGLSEKSITRYLIRADEDDGKYEYDVIFIDDSSELVYETEVDALTGKVGASQRGWCMSFYNESRSYISADRAKAIALMHVHGASESHLVSFELETEDGGLQYEGKIVYGGMEYEFSIDYYSGAIREWDVEPVDD